MTDTAGGIASAILERFSEKRGPAENEYLGENGLLYCSKCHTPVQCRVNMFGTPKIEMCTPVHVSGSDRRKSIGMDKQRTVKEVLDL